MERYAGVAARSKTTFLAGGRGGHLMDIEKLKRIRNAGIAITVINLILLAVQILLLLSK